MPALHRVHIVYPVVKGSLSPQDTILGKPDVSVQCGRRYFVVGVFSVTYEALLFCEFYESEIITSFSDAVNLAVTISHH